MKHIARHLFNLLLLTGTLPGLTACQTQPVRMTAREDVLPLLSEHVLHSGSQPAPSLEMLSASSDTTPPSTRVQLLPAQHGLLVETGANLSTLRHALINILLMPHNPTRTNPVHLPLPIRVTQEPFLYGLVVDQHQFPIASRKQAESYAEWLLQHALHTIRKEGRLIRRILIPITEGYTSSDLTELLSVSPAQSFPSRTEKDSSAFLSFHPLAEWNHR